MKVVSVVNYKGGVGKTTLTANIGAGLAAQGERVLLIDLDPQASLTFSFFTQDEWLDDLSRKRTIKQWYDAADTATPIQLADLISTPPRVNQHVAHTGGWLDLVASHLDLMTSDSSLASTLAETHGPVPAGRFLQVYRRLADALADPSFADYSVVLIDCAPTFNIMTRNAIVASDFLLIPSKPDYLSTRGIDFLGRKVQELIEEYNRHAAEAGTVGEVVPIRQPSAGVVFTMVQFYAGQPVRPHSAYINRIRALGAPTFSALVRDRQSLFAEAPEYGVPAILLNGNKDVIGELNQLLDEFRTRIGRTRP